MMERAYSRGWIEAMTVAAVACSVLAILGINIVIGTLVFSCVAAAIWISSRR